MKRMGIWLRILKYFLLSINCTHKAQLLDVFDTINKINNYGLSLIRLGDGELNIIDGIDVHYQKADESLSNEMSKLITDYITVGTESGYLLCMPNDFLKCSGFQLAKKRVWIASWSRFRFVFKKNYDVNIVYGDSFLFAKEYEHLYSRLWEYKKHVIFVHNKKIYADQFSQKYRINVSFIKIPIRECYQEIDNIINEMQKCINELSCSKQEAVILVSAGPCAKIIVYRMKECGVQIIDTGHCWDEPLALMGGSNIKT